MKKRLKLYMVLMGITCLGNHVYAQTDTSRQDTATAAVTDTAAADTVDTTAATDSLNQTADTVAVAPRPVRRIIKRRPKPISKEFSVGFRLNSDGWTLFADKGWVQSEDRYSDLFYDIKFAQFELGEKKHQKELKRSNTLSTGPSADKPKPYIYGKINNFYTAKLGYGKRKMIAGKPEPGNISIHWVYLGGVSLGMEKPYYLEAIVQESPGGPAVLKNITYTDTTKGPFLEQYNIVGGAGFSEGLTEIKFIPGIHAKTALHFDFSAKKKTKLAIETGVNAELYSRPIAIMANQKAVPFFINIYASIQFGKRK